MNFSPFLLRTSVFSFILTSLLCSCGTTHVVYTERPAQPAYSEPSLPPSPPSSGPGSYQTFYDALSPYGQWFDDPQFGYAWIPNVGSEFEPYRSNGHWTYTDYGWTWVSGYPWGWATFHYGRWRFDDQYGWIWIPGHEWGPAWVAWRSNDSYFGWAPLSPHADVSISVNFGAEQPRPEHWNFVPRQYVSDLHVQNYYVAPRQNVTIINNTTIIRNTIINNTTVNNQTVINNRNVTNNTVNNKTVYVSGPSAAEVEKSTGVRISPVKLTTSSNPTTSHENGNQLVIYKPVINAAPTNSAGQNLRPANSVKLDAVQTLNQRGSGNGKPGMNQSGNAAPQNQNGQNRSMQNPNGNTALQNQNGQNRGIQNPNGNAAFQNQNGQNRNMQNPSGNSAPQNQNGQNRNTQNPNRNASPQNQNGQNGTNQNQTGNGQMHNQNGNTGAGNQQTNGNQPLNGQPVNQSQQPSFKPVNPNPGFSTKPRLQRPVTPGSPQMARPMVPNANLNTLNSPNNPARSGNSRILPYNKNQINKGIPKKSGNKPGPRTRKDSLPR